MTTATSSRLNQLLTLLPRGGSVVPRDLTDVAFADQLLDLVIVGASNGELAAACEGRTYRDGYAIRPMTTWDFGELRRLVYDARCDIARVARDIDQLQQRRDSLARLLSPPTERTTS